MSPNGDKGERCHLKNSGTLNFVHQLICNWRLQHIIRFKTMFSRLKSNKSHELTVPCQLIIRKNYYSQICSMRKIFSDWLCWLQASIQHNILTQQQQSFLCWYYPMCCVCCCSVFSNKLRALLFLLTSSIIFPSVCTFQLIILPAYSNEYGIS